MSIRPTDATTPETSAGTLVCPRCGYAERATMPEDARRVLWFCSACDARLTPEAGDCCVFCSYGDAPCPPVQRAGPRAR